MRSRAPAKAIPEVAEHLVRHLPLSVPLHHRLLHGTRLAGVQLTEAGPRRQLDLADRLLAGRGWRTPGSPPSLPPPPSRRPRADRSCGPPAARTDATSESTSCPTGTMPPSREATCSEAIRSAPERASSGRRTRTGTGTLSSGAESCVATVPPTPMARAWTTCSLATPDRAAFSSSTESRSSSCGSMSDQSMSTTPGCSANRAITCSATSLWARSSGP